MDSDRKQRALSVAFSILLVTSISVAGISFEASEATAKSISVEWGDEPPDRTVDNFEVSLDGSVEKESEACVAVKRSGDHFWSKLQDTCRSVDGDLDGESWTVDPEEDVEANLGAEFRIRLVVTHNHLSLVHHTERTEAQTVAFNHLPTSSRDFPENRSVTIREGKEWSFFIDAADEDGNLDTALWYVEDGDPVKTDSLQGSSDSSSLTRTFDETGTYTVFATVNDDLDAYNDDAALWLVSVKEAHELSVRLESDNGRISVSPHGRSYTAGTNHTATYLEGTEVNISAYAVSGYRFSHWKGDYEDGQRTDPTITVTVDEEQSLTPVFERARYQLKVQDPTGGGLSVDPPGTTSPGGFEYTYDSGTSVTLEAQPYEGYSFTRWDGDVPFEQQYEASVTLEMDKNRTIIPIFEADTHELSISDVDGGGFSVHPPGSTHNRDFARDYDDGTAVTVTARPNTGYIFDRWEGDLPDTKRTDRSLTLSMDTDRSLTPSFTATESESYQLTVSDPDHGSFAVDPPGASFKSSFAQTYDDGTTVSLEATPHEGYVFDHWEGDISEDQRTQAAISVTMSQNRSVTPVFTEVPTSEYDLTVPTVANGTVSVDPPDASYVGGFTQTYDEGTRVSLTATPDSGHVFDHWKGDVSADQVNDSSITVEMDGGVSATPVFRLKETPEPSLVAVKAPSETTTAEEFTIYVEARNDGAKAGGSSTISISFPQHEETAIVTSTQTSLAEIRRLDADDTIAHRTRGSIQAQYALIEGGTGADGWQAGDSRYLSVDVAPETSSTFVFNVRTTLTDPSDATETTTAPATSEQTDQQGYHVERHEITVKSAVDGDIETISGAPQQYAAGTWYELVVPVRNSGPSKKRFAVTLPETEGVSVQGSRTKHTTIAGGDDATVSYRVKFSGRDTVREVDAELSYDGRSLDSESITVPPQETGDLTVRVVDGDGDSLPDATVHIQGTGTTETGGSDQVSFSDLAVTTHSVYVELGSTRTPTKLVNVSASGTTVTFRLERATISGTVTDTDGEAVPVSIARETTLTDADGEFSITGYFKPGDHIVRATVDGTEYTETIGVVPGQDNEVTVETTDRPGRIEYVFRLESIFLEDGTLTESEKAEVRPVVEALHPADQGFVFGDFGQKYPDLITGSGSIPYFAGWMLGVVYPVVDVVTDKRDCSVWIDGGAIQTAADTLDCAGAVVNVVGTAAAITGIGAVAATGEEVTDVSSITAKFLTRNPEKVSEVAGQLRNVFSKDAALAVVRKISDLTGAKKSKLESAVKSQKGTKVTIDEASDLVKRIDGSDGLTKYRARRLANNIDNFGDLSKGEQVAAIKIAHRGDEGAATVNRLRKGFDSAPSFTQTAKGVTVVGKVDGVTTEIRYVDDGENYLTSLSDSVRSAEELREMSSAKIGRDIVEPEVAPKVLERSGYGVTYGKDGAEKGIDVIAKAPDGTIVIQEVKFTRQSKKPNKGMFGSTRTLNDGRTVEQMTTPWIQNSFRKEITKSDLSNYATVERAMETKSYRKEALIIQDSNIGRTVTSGVSERGFDKVTIIRTGEATQ